MPDLKTRLVFSCSSVTFCSSAVTVAHPDGFSLWHPSVRNAIWSTFPKEQPRGHLVHIQSRETREFFRLQDVSKRSKDLGGNVSLPYCWLRGFGWGVAILTHMTPTSWRGRRKRGVQSWSDQKATLCLFLGDLCPLTQVCPTPGSLHHGKICTNSRLHVPWPQCWEELETSPSLSIWEWGCSSQNLLTHLLKWCWGEGALTGPLWNWPL